jgi:hypothetical protein
MHQWRGLTSRSHPSFVPDIIVTVPGGEQQKEVFLHLVAEEARESQ